jgi:cell division GTPase FtsZ
MEIDLDYADYKTINAHKGFTIGFNSNIVPINNLEVELLQRLKTHLEKAKGVLIKYTINEDKNLLDISAIMEKLNNIIDNDTEIIFGTEIDNNLKIEECRFHILITGLETI